LACAAAVQINAAAGPPRAFGAHKAVARHRHRSRPSAPTVVRQRWSQYSRTSSLGTKPDFWSSSSPTARWLAYGPSGLGDQRSATLYRPARTPSSIHCAPYASHRGARRLELRNRPEIGGADAPSEFGPLRFREHDNCIARYRSGFIAARIRQLLRNQSCLRRLSFEEHYYGWMK